MLVCEELDQEQKEYCGGGFCTHRSANLGGPKKQTNEKYEIRSKTSRSKRVGLMELEEGKIELMSYKKTFRR